MAVAAFLIVFHCLGSILVFEYGGGISSERPRAPSDCCASLIHAISALSRLISAAIASYSALRPETHSTEPIFSSNDASWLAIGCSSACRRCCRVGLVVIVEGVRLCAALGPDLGDISSEVESGEGLLDSPADSDSTLFLDAASSSGGININWLEINARSTCEFESLMDACLRERG
jgi:hypothetical protein